MKSRQLGLRSARAMGGASVFAIGCLACALVAGVSEPARAQAVADAPTIPDALSSARVPSVRGIDEYIQNADAAIVLGKALFWDTAIGSDGIACARRCIARDVTSS